MPIDTSVSIEVSSSRARLRATRWNCQPKTNTTGVARAHIATLAAVPPLPNQATSKSGAVKTAANATLRCWNLTTASYFSVGVSLASPSTIGVSR